MPLRILVIEDDASLRALVVDVVQDLGHEAVAFAEGDDAIAHLRSSPASIDLVIADLMLPGKSGLETLRALRAIRPDLAALLSSGHDDTSARVADGAIATARREGIEILAKPYRVDALEAAISSAMRRGGQPT